MEFLQLKDISERYMELVNPISPEKVLTVGRIAGLESGHRVIDFGCGYGEVLALWAEYFGISGVGIDVRPYACQRAEQKMAERGFQKRIEIVCGSATEYRFEPHTYRVAASLGSSFIWNGFEGTIRATKEAITPEGKLIIGQPYWQKEPVPSEFAETLPWQPEYQLLQAARQEGFDVETVVRASHEDWDQYESTNWYGLLRWIEENPSHPERQEVIDHLHSSQEAYFRYGREYLGWAIYVLSPVKYS
jgi:SAM-dependent methyltransferase